MRRWVPIRAASTGSISLATATLLALSSGTSNALNIMSPSPLVIDSHLHVWATANESSSQFPYDGAPPQQLQDAASPELLLERMKDAGVDGALIVQPINHKFDHSYVTHAIRKYPNRFRGMLLHDPSLTATFAVERVEQLVLSGYVGVRFNPYLWPEGSLMSDDSGSGLAVYKRCGEMNVPVGVMCFNGLGLHYDDILALIDKSPNTVLIVDHMGFCALNDDGDRAFEQLLSLAAYANVIVKVSALFRNTGGVDSFPYERIRRDRFVPLLREFGSRRLMMGTDFPYVIETEGSYVGAVDVVRSWVPEGDERDAIMGGNARRLFGSWESCEIVT